MKKKERKTCLTEFPALQVVSIPLKLTGSSFKEEVPCMEVFAFIFRKAAHIVKIISVFYS